MDCIFCKIINKQIPAKIVFENADVVAFHDINPKAKVHVLIVPKVHRAGLSVLNNDDALLAGKLLVNIPAVAKQVNLKDFRVVINNGKEAGQTVFHLHVHLMSCDGFLV